MFLLLALPFICVSFYIGGHKNGYKKGQQELSEVVLKEIESLQFKGL
jgi:hypothetical protein